MSDLTDDERAVVTSAAKGKDPEARGVREILFDGSLIDALAFLKSRIDQGLSTIRVSFPDRGTAPFSIADDQLHDLLNPTDVKPELKPRRNWRAPFQG